jgi:hypothetical protein
MLPRFVSSTAARAAKPAAVCFSGLLDGEAPSVVVRVFVNPKRRDTPCWRETKRLVERRCIENSEKYLLVEATIVQLKTLHDLAPDSRSLIGRTH